MTWKSRIMRASLWGLPLPLWVLNGWVLLLLLDYFHSLITVVVTAMLLAFVLEYPVFWLQRLPMRRQVAVLSVLLCFGLLLLVLGITLVPVLISQVNDLGDRLPVWMVSGSGQLKALQDWASVHQLPIDLSHWITQLETQVANQLQAVSGAIVSTLVGAIGSILNLLLTLVLTFYLLLHGQRLGANLFGALPHSVGLRLQQTLRKNFHNYFVGQAIVALLMGMAMTIAFLLVGIPFGLVFGLGIGLLAMFPFGASVGITIVSFLTGLSSLWLGLKVLVIAILIEQLIDNGIAPQLIGGFVGLNPVWILIALLIGAKITGILGIIVAVPIAGSIRDMLLPAETQPAVH